MEAVKFILIFVFSHNLAYILAGVIALKISKDIYESKNRYCDFLRDMSDKEESRHVSIWFLPAQIVRGFLMSVVLLPVLSVISDFSFPLLLVFLSSLMFVYTHIAAVSPFVDNIEGFVYFRRKYFRRNVLLKFQLEMVIYSVLFGIFMGILMRIFFQKNI